MTYEMYIMLGYATSFLIMGGLGIYIVQKYKAYFDK